MNTLSKTKRRILNDLKDRETRQMFYSEHISSAIPIQIRELRKKRKFTQKTLGQLAEMDQSTISDLENPNYEYAPQIGTLERLANAFDVPLIVRFGSWEELWDWENNLTPEKLAPRRFDEVLPKLEASLSPEAIAPARSRPFNLIEGGGEATPSRPLDNFLGRNDPNQRLGGKTQPDTDKQDSKPQNHLFAQAAAGSQR